MRLAAVLASVLLTSCASTPAEPAKAAAPAIAQVGAEVKSWGVTLRQWTVDASGNVEHSSGGGPGVDLSKVVVEVRRTKLSQAQLDAVRGAIGRVKTILAQPEHCDQMMTDGPYGNFRWSEGGKTQDLKFSANCVAGRDAHLATAIFDADEIVTKAARLTQPVERRPYQQQP